MKRIFSSIFMVVFVILLGVSGSGCIRDYMEPLFLEVGNNHTIFVFPLEDDANKQIKFNSTDDLLNKRVQQRRIEISQKFHQTGHRRWMGYWIPQQLCVIVDRQPVARQWTATPDTGTSPHNEAIIGESKDSIGLIIPWNCTANILEGDTAVFLSLYPGIELWDYSGYSLFNKDHTESSLVFVMDTEVRNKIQEAATEFCSQYDLDDLRQYKNELVKHVNDVINPFFKSRGINITTSGIAGDLRYLNPRIQSRIDDVFLAKQEKNSEQALLNATTDKKERMRRDGVAEANQKREIMRGDAKAITVKAEAEAAGIRAAADAEAAAILRIAEACEGFDNVDAVISIMSLKVEEQRIQKWDGQVPAFASGELSGFVPQPLNLDK